MIVWFCGEAAPRVESSRPILSTQDFDSEGRSWLCIYSGILR